LLIEEEKSINNQQLTINYQQSTITLDFELDLTFEL